MAGMPVLVEKDVSRVTSIFRWLFTVAAASFKSNAAVMLSSCLGDVKEVDWHGC